MQYNQAVFNVQHEAVRQQEHHAAVWQDFCNSFELLAMSVNEQLLTSPPDRLVLNQGRAQMMRDLVIMLATARQAVEAVRSQQNVHSQP